jgi:hypothetical protein
MKMEEIAEPYRGTEETHRKLQIRRASPMAGFEPATPGKESDYSQLCSVAWCF